MTEAFLPHIGSSRLRRESPPALGVDAKGLDSCLRTKPMGLFQRECVRLGHSQMRWQASRRFKGEVPKSQAVPHHDYRDQRKSMKRRSSQASILWFGDLLSSVQSSVAEEIVLRMNTRWLVAG